MTIQREIPAIPPQIVSLKAPVKEINTTMHPQQSTHQNYDGSYLLFESSILRRGQWLMPANYFVVLELNGPHEGHTNKMRF